MIDQKQVETVEYFNYLGSTIKNDARSTLEIKSNTVMTIEAMTDKNLFVSKLGLNFIKELEKLCISIKFLYGADPWALRKLDRKYIGNFLMWCW
jgi:hypothetical protein